jgi:hypothetical protein
MSAEII